MKVWRSWLTRGVGARLRDPLYRNGYALVASSTLTSALGLVYWLVAARSYSTEAVGISAALIAALTLLGQISQLNLKSALNRFLPEAGRQSRRFVLGAYAAGMAVGAVTAVVFVAGVELWSPETDFLTQHPDIAAAFIIGVMAWTIFILQDSVLVGIREAGWVPVENLIFAVGKIVALVAFASAFPTLGVFLAWIVLLPILILAVNALILLRLLPRHIGRTLRAARPPRRRHVASYIGLDYVAFLFWSGTVGILPLLVLNVAGAEANAHFYVAWAVGYALYVITSGMGMSLITEGALDRARLAEYGRRAAIESARLVVPAALLVVLAAPVLLDLMGGDYSAEATNLLRLLALSAIPYVVVATAANVARVERKLSRVIAIYGTLSVMVLGMSWLLLEQIGIVGVGVAWLIAQSIVCTAILAPALLGRLARQIPSPLLRIAAAPYHALGRGARRRRAVSAAPSILSAMGCGEFATVHALDGDGSVAVVRVSAPEGRSAIAKFGVTAEGSAAVERNARLVEELQQDERLAPFRATLPEIWTSYAGDPRATLERDIPGVRLDSLLGGPHRRPALAAAVAAIEKIHEATSVDVTVDDDVLEVLVERPLRAISLIRATDRTPDNLADAVRGRLRGSTLRMSRTHGDFTPRNILVRPDGTAVEGIVDWEGSSPLDIPELDLAHLALAVRMHDTGRELGALVKVLVTQPGTPSLGCELGRRSLGLEGLHDSEGLLAMLAWLRHAEINIAKSDRYAPGSVWFDRNIEPVLTTLSSTWRATPLPPASRA